MAGPIVGEIRILAGTDAPPGWACCDGQQLPVREYPELFSVLGTTYGGDGRQHFALPDLRSRTPVHADGGAYRLGHSGGEAGHALTSSELPGHAHGSLGLIGSGASATGVVTISATNGSSAPASQSYTLESSTGAAAEPHDNLQPYLGLTFVIALHGVSPSGK